MNIIPAKSIEEWESDFLRTGDISLVPEEDRERVLHELDVLREEAQTLLARIETKIHI